MKKKLHWAYWMARYWMLDKYNLQFRAFGFLATNIVSTIMVARLFLRVMTQVTAPKVQKAYIDPGLIYLAILIVAVLLSYALRPRPKVPQAEQGQQPTTKDGRALRRAYGSNWVDDSSMVGWANGSPEPIKSSGKK